MNSLENQITQHEFAELIGVSDPTVSGLVKRGILEPGATGAAWLKAYCAHLREQAAGRSPSLTEARTSVALEQKALLRLKKQRELGEWAPIENLTLVLSRVTAQMAAQFDAIPIRLKQAFPEVTGTQLNLIRTELANIRNLLVSVGAEAVTNEAARLVDYVDEFDFGEPVDEEPR
ncbi:hypothetical protein [Methylocaldum sp.]|uniref:hypothetical protein n=1 Tax=Methylocaldum sp. TaxID=1969727 RepID=UPI002D553282|nr:hypothetical protein [Methylocaldum sp.]HYE35385.1 hypothetical protein [Methylocaldum sp.]